MSKNQLKNGILLSYINMLLGSIIPFIYTPIMLRIVGQAEYGVYSMAQSVMGHLGLLNLGIGGTIVRYLAKYHAQNNLEDEQKTAGLFIKIYIVIGVLILSAGLFCASNIHIFKKTLTEDEVLKLRILIILLSVFTAFFLPFSVFVSITIAHERFVANKLIAITATVLSPCLNLILLYRGYKSLGLVAGSAISSLLINSCYVYYVLCKLKVHPSFKRTNNSLIREILKFSFYVFLANIVDTLFWTTDRLIIGFSIGATSVAVYSIGATFNSYLTNISTTIVGVLMPRVTDMVVKDAPKEEFTKIFIKVGRIQFILVSFIISAFISFGQIFIRIWTGEGYEAAYYVALWTMIPLSIPLIQNIGINILYALNKHKFRSLVYLFIAILNVIMTFLWVDKYGIIGAAAATCIAYILGQGFIMNLYYNKKIGIDIPLFWKNILKMSPVMIIMGLGCWYVLRYVELINWISFFTAAVLYTVLYFIAAYLFMMNQYEKKIFLAPLRRIYDFIHKFRIGTR